jgi:hypothetical protein
MKRHSTAGLVVMPKCGHTINIEEPDAFNRIISDSDNRRGGKMGCAKPRVPECISDLTARAFITPRVIPVDMIHSGTNTFLYGPYSPCVASIVGRHLANYASGRLCLR